MPTDKQQLKPVRAYWTQATVARAGCRPFDEITVTMTDEGAGAFLVLTGPDMDGETGLRVDLDELEVVLVVARQMLAQEEANGGEQ